MRTLGRAAWLLLAACRFDGALAPGLTIACDDGVCPGERVCQPTTHRCVPASELDVTPPELVAGSERLTLLPPLQSPALTVTRLGLGGAALIRFELTEPLGAPPVLESTPALTCAISAPVGNSFELTCRLPPTTPAMTGAVPLTLRFADVLGNPGSATLALSLVVDTRPPPTPDTVTADRVLLHREPTGSSTAGPGARAFVQGSAGAAEPDSTVIARLPASSLELGRAVVDSTGAFGPLTLVLGDVGAVDVFAFDEAGNVSGQVLVHDVVVVARPGATHIADARSVHGPGLDRVDVAAQDHPALERIDGRVLEVTAALSWRRKTDAYPVGGWRGAASVFDTRRARVVRFGGVGGAFGVFGDTNVWEWTGEDWLSLTPADPEGDGNPANRAQLAGSYDPERGEMIVFGGRSLLDGMYGDTWAWNGVSWQRLSEEGPSLRIGAAMAYDVGLGRSVLFGGGDVYGAVYGDTWAFGGRTWSPLDAGPGPSARVGHGLVYDTDGRRLVLFGGTGADGGALDDTWVLTAGRWAPLDPLQRPPPTPKPLMAWDTGRARGVLFTGDAGTDVWELAGDAWSTAGVTGSPLDLAGAVCAAYDPARGQTLISGAWGCVGLPFCFPFDQPTFTWDGGSLVTVSRGAPRWLPPGSVAAVGARSGSTFAVGAGQLFGSSSSTWRLDGWWQELDAGAQPVGGPWTIAPGPAPDELTLLPRLDPTTWVLRGDGGWTSRPTASPVAASRALLLPLEDLVWAGEPFSTFASSPLAAVLFTADAGWALTTSIPDAGYIWAGTGLADGGIWFGSYDGVAQSDGWLGTLRTNRIVQYTPGPPMPQRLEVAVGHDAARDRLVAFSGRVNASAPPGGGLIEWVDAGWQRAAVSDPEGDGLPADRTGAQLIWQAQLRRLLLVGGAIGAVGLSDTWQLEGAGLKPSIVLRVDVKALAVPAAAAVTAVEVEAIAGGSGGATLELWRDGAFRPLSAQNAAPLDAPAAVRAQLSDPATLWRLFTHQPWLAAAVVPRTGTGAEPARLAVDDVQLRVRYRLP